MEKIFEFAKLLIAGVVYIVQEKIVREIKSSNRKKLSAINILDEGEFKPSSTSTATHQYLPSASLNFQLEVPANVNNSLNEREFISIALSILETTSATFDESHETNGGIYFGSQEYRKACQYSRLGSVFSFHRFINIRSPHDVLLHGCHTNTNTRSDLVISE